MREVEVDNRPVLIVREEGKYYAVGSKCTHYGAPLVKGRLSWYDLMNIFTTTAKPDHL